MVSVDNTDLTAELARDKLSQMCKSLAPEVVVHSIPFPTLERDVKLMEGTLSQVSLKVLKV